jgi:hypothetical protein
MRTLAPAPTSARQDRSINLPGVVVLTIDSAAALLLVLPALFVAEQLYIPVSAWVALPLK